MNKQLLQRFTQLPQTLLLLFGLTLLASCGTAPQNASEPPKATYYLLSVALQPGDSQSALEQRYGGKAIVWREGQKAVIRLSAQALAANRAQGVSIQTQNLEADQTVYQPEVQAAGWNAWAGGWNAWAGGWNAWAGGWNAWAGGLTPPQPPTANNDIWQQIRLAQAQQAGKKLGLGVTVAVLDTGIDLGHPIFQGRLASSADMRNFVDERALPQEGNSSGWAYGHGTGVAGIIAQVAPKATILPIRVLDSDGQGSLSQIVSGVYWAADHAQIINLSLGSYEWSQALFDALVYAARKGVYIVASAGNGHQENPTFPAQLSWNNDLRGFLLGVGSIDQNYLLSSFSNYGNGLFISAPGEQISSAYPDNRIAKLTGTSFSAPLVSGALALLLSETQNQSQRWQLTTNLANGSIQGNILTKNQQLRGTDRLGVGILDIESALYNLDASSLSNKSNQTSSFEGDLSDWTLESATTGLVAHSGEKSLALGSGGKASRGYTVKPNTGYVASVWIKNDNPNNRPGLWIWGFDGSGKLGNGRSNTVADSSSYVRLSLAFTTGFSDTAIQIGVWSNSGIAYFDDLTLTEVGN